MKITKYDDESGDRDNNSAIFDEKVSRVLKLLKTTHFCIISENTLPLR